MTCDIYCRRLLIDNKNKIKLKNILLRIMQKNYKSSWQGKICKYNRIEEKH